MHAQRRFRSTRRPHENSPHVEIGRKRAHYQAELEKHGHSIEGRDIPMARLLALGKTLNTESQAGQGKPQRRRSSFHVRSPQLPPNPGLYAEEQAEATAVGF